jgi:polyphosphate glucokinase
MSPRPKRPASAALRTAIGLDVGGTGVKAAVVDLVTGELASPRLRAKTPQPATPAAVVEAIGGIVDQLVTDGFVTPDMRVGAGLPGVVKAGRLVTAANIDKSWIEAPAEAMLAARLGRSVRLINDADAAGLAEATFGAAKGVQGTVLVLTLGTGIGSAILIDGHLLDSTEFGHVTYHGKDAETLVSGTARVRRGLGWKKWGQEFSEFLALLERWFWPDLIILGGGGSKDYAKYSKFLTARAPVVTAQYLNTSGIVGAALAAAGVGIAAAVLAREDAPAPGTADPCQAGPADVADLSAAVQASAVAASLVIEDQPPR